MPVYAFRGVASSGRNTRGFIDAESSRAARDKLRRDGVYLTDLSESRAPERRATPRRAPLRLPTRRVRTQELALATRQLATLIGAGVPLLSALSALSEQVEGARLKGVFGEIRDSVNQGNALADALRQAGGFPPLYIALVRAGEAGGALDPVLRRLADYLEGQARLRNRVISILVYPCFMFALLVIVVALLVTLVLPQITDLLLSLDRELPTSTRFVIATADLCRNYWWALLGGAAAWTIVVRLALRSDAIRLRYDRAILRVPITGRTARLLAIARFSRTLGTLLSGGLPIVRALEIARHVTGNRVLATAIDAARDNVTEGAPLARPLRASNQFPPLAVHMIEVGEQSGELEAMLEKVAESYEEQVETQITRLTALLEPLLILLMVGVVSAVIAATLLPLLEVTTSIGEP